MRPEDVLTWEITLQIDAKQLAQDINELPRKPHNVNADEEANYLTDLITSNPVVLERLKNYAEPKIVGVGGSGIILRCTYTPNGNHRALKFPRKRQYNDAQNDPATVDIDPERKALEKVSHQNITRLYEAFELPNDASFCMITEFIPGDDTLDTYVPKLICNKECRESEERLTAALKTLAAIVHSIASALRYLHNDAKLFHFDIKPENILISPLGTPFVSDLGFAREVDGYKPDETVEVGFTWKYAHPRLQDPHRGALVTNVPQKAKTPLKGHELAPRFDVFAFGRTLQEILGLLSLEYGERIQSMYIFDYLHVVACLCLDGKNGSTIAPTKRGEFAPDGAMGMSINVYRRSPFSSFDDACLCLERLIGVRRFEDELPEVDRWFGSTIKVAETGSTTLTPRVASILSHPALQRLQGERQLGMLDNIFPTATHTRFQHTLGSYHAATLYLAALYYDPENPLFRALIDIKKCEALLVAMLIHDIGHTAYGHELEEIDASAFGHRHYLPILIASKAFEDAKGRTVAQIIEGDDDGCWRLSLSNVLAIFDRPAADRAPFEGVLHDILDSQIDADKFDYLVRDSVEARVTYGFGIDLDRFLRSLTTYALDDGVLRLAIKQKGAPAAEAFALARYQLYQSMYWHHTFRATKAMLVEAIQRIQTDLQEGTAPDMFDRNSFRTAYIQHVLGASDYQQGSTPAQRRKKETKDSSPTTSDKIESRLSRAAPQLPLRYRDDAFMAFLVKLANKPQATALVRDLVSRNYYKRLLELSPAQLTQPDWEDFRDRFRRERAAIQIAVQEKLVDALRSRVQSIAQARETLDSNATLSRIATISAEKVLFLVDVPLRGWFAANEPPIYVSDYKRRHFRAGASDRGHERREDFWIKMLGDSMKAAAYIRVFCEPEVHSMILSVMDTKDVYEAVVSAIPELRFR